MLRQCIVLNVVLYMLVKFNNSNALYELAVTFKWYIVLLHSLRF